MADLSKLKGKLDVQKIMDSVKSMINPGPVPEISKDDPTGYYLSNIATKVKVIIDYHAKQGDELAKLDAMLGDMAKELAAQKAASSKKEAPSKPAEDKAKEKDKS